MLPYLREDFGNPSSSTHVYGWRAEAAVEDARERIAAAIGARPSEIVFTSGTTESDNLALKGVAWAGRSRGDHLVTVATEHPAVLDPCRALAEQGFRATTLPVDAQGLVDPDDVRRALGKGTLLVSVMAANSEIGVLQPLPEIGRVCREAGVLFHSDAAQAVGRIPVDVDALGVDLLSFCAHKLYGPKGIGALYVRERRPRVRLEPLLHGGGHERGRRSGTLPVAQIAGFARAVELCLAELEAEAARLRALRDRLWQRLRDALPDLRVNGDPERRLPGNWNVAFAGVEASALLARLAGVALSSGSACASGRGEPSHVLRALGLSDALCRAAVRFGLGRSNTPEEIDVAAAQLVLRVREARAARESGAPARRLSSQ